MIHGDEFVLEKADHADLDEIMQLKVSTEKDSETACQVTVYNQILENWNINKFDYLHARIDDKILGFAEGVFVDKYDWEKKSGSRIYLAKTVLVSEAYRGLGYGRRITMEFINFVKNTHPEATHMVAEFCGDDTEALDFGVKMGFTRRLKHERDYKKLEQDKPYLLIRQL